MWLNKNYETNCLVGFNICVSNTNLTNEKQHSSLNLFGTWLVITHYYCNCVAVSKTDAARYQVVLVVAMLLSNNVMLCLKLLLCQCCHARVIVVLCRFYCYADVATVLIPHQCSCYLTLRMCTRYYHMHVCRYWCDATCVHRLYQAVTTWLIPMWQFCMCPITTLLGS